MYISSSIKFVKKKVFSIYSVKRKIYIHFAFKFVVELDALVSDL